MLITNNVKYAGIAGVSTLVLALVVVVGILMAIDYDKQIRQAEWMEWYRTADLNELQSISRDFRMAMYDFEVMFHSDIDGNGSFIAVALMAQKEILLGTYDPTLNEKIYHEWVIEKYDPPTTIDEIDKALLELVGTEDNLHFAEEIYQIMTDAADKADVPLPLRLSNVTYWTIEKGVALCIHFEEDCDPEQKRAEITSSIVKSRAPPDEDYLKYLEELRYNITNNIKGDR